MEDQSVLLPDSAGGFLSLQWCSRSATQDEWMSIMSSSDEGRQTFLDKHICALLRVQVTHPCP